MPVGGVGPYEGDGAEPAELVVRNARVHTGDLAVLGDDYFSVPEAEISRIESVLTIVGGKVSTALEHSTVPPRRWRRSSRRGVRSRASAAFSVRRGACDRRRVCSTRSSIPPSNDHGERTGARFSTTWTRATHSRLRFLSGSRALRRAS